MGDRKCVRRRPSTGRAGDPGLAVLVLAFSAVVAPGLDASELLHISTAQDTRSEQAARQQLQQLVARFDVADWVFTTDILIDDSQWIPHSHPVLTLNSRYLDDDHSQLATFLHEQFHWFAESESDRIDAAIAAFKTTFPTVPGGRQGARDEYSTYLHLIICDLEYAAMQILVGDANARQVLQDWQHYTWIYDQVLNNPEVRAINERNGLTPP